MSLQYIQWKTVKEFEKYEVSSKGQVRNVKTKKVLNPFILKNGDYQVCLYRNGQKPRKIHRLVAEAFVDNPNNYKFIKHLDGNKNNNSVNNLAWCQMNDLGFFEKSLIRTKEKNSKAIQMLDLHENIIGNYGSLKECSYKTGLGIKAISDCATGKVKQVLNKKFRFGKENK